MRVGIVRDGNWLVALPAMVALSAMVTLSAMAQEPKKTTDTPAAESPIPGKGAQPSPGQGNSQVDNRTYMIGENDVLDIDVWKEKDIWTRQFESSAKAWPLNHEALGVLDRKGHFVLISLADGTPTIGTRAPGPSRYSSAWTWSWPWMKSRATRTKRRFTGH